MHNLEHLNTIYMAAYFLIIVYLFTLNSKSLSRVREKMQHLETEIENLYELLDDKYPMTPQAILKIIDALQCRYTDLQYENELSKTEALKLNDKLLDIKEYVKSLEDKYHKLYSAFSAYLGTTKENIND